MVIVIIATTASHAGAALDATPDHVVCRQWLEPMAKLLRDAAELSENAAFATFLRLRADAPLSDDYFQSDLTWLDLDNPKVDVIFAPCETYLDGLLGVKTSYVASVLVGDDVESRRLDVYQQYVPGIQDALPLAAEDRPSEKGPAFTDGDHGCAVSSRRPGARIPGRGGQPAQ